MTVVEKARLERTLRMGGGYVLDFSNRTFCDFVQHSVRIDPYDERFDSGGDSKANRLRSIWSMESDAVVGKLLRDILDYAVVLEFARADDPEHQAAHSIANRLLSGPFGEDLEKVTAQLSSAEFDVVLEEVRNAIERNRPEAGLDRLHTLVSKYLRSVCARRGIPDSRERPLHSVMGAYVKALRDAGEIRSEMTERILKSAIGTLEAFNRVRNDQSLAHDNELLGSRESMLIFNNVCSVLRFVAEIEVQVKGGVRS